MPDSRKTVGRLTDFLQTSLCFIPSLSEHGRSLFFQNHRFGQQRFRVVNRRLATGANVRRKPISNRLPEIHNPAERTTEFCQFVQHALFLRDQLQQLREISVVNQTSLPTRQFQHRAAVLTPPLEDVKQVRLLR